MTKNELLKDTRALQRVLKVDRLYTGKIDGIHGSKTAAALKEWTARQEKAAKSYSGISARSAVKLDAVAARLALAVRVWMVTKVQPWAEKNGMTAHIVDGMRSIQEQNALSGAVTKAKGVNSYHVHGAAVDVGLFDNGGKHYIERDKPYADLYKACGAPAGCLWGGTFTSFYDAPHYQLADWGKGIQPLLNYLGI